MPYTTRGKHGRYPQCVRVTSRALPDTDGTDALNEREHRALRVVRRFGMFGSLLLAVGSLGAGAAPVLNPVLDIPVLQLFPRIPAASLAVAVAGMGIVVVAWLLLGRFARPDRPRVATKGQLHRVMLLWAVPLAAIPPLFSRDVYAYLAQSKIAFLGMDPYSLGPAQALGVDDPLTMGVDNLWRETPAPYGPLFLWIGSWIIHFTGNNVMAGVLLQRGLALAGVALIVWALPRLAARFGVRPSTALWLGAANPLVLFHLIAGAHNDALAIGLMVAGLEIGLRKLPIRTVGDRVPPLTRSELAHLAAGATVISLGAAVKINAIVALGFFGVMIARRWHGRFVDLLRVGIVMVVIAAAVLVAVSFGTGLGFGWIGSLATPGTIRSWLSPLAQLVSLGTLLGTVLGFGNLSAGLAPLLQTLAMLTAAAITVKFLVDGMRWRYRPIIGLGVSLGAFMVLHIALHPWWLLWAVVPLAASAGTSRFRAAATAGSVFLAVATFPTGSTFLGRIFVVEQTYIAGLIVVGLAVLVVWFTAPELLRWEPRHRTRPETRRTAGAGDRVGGWR